MRVIHVVVVRLKYDHLCKALPMVCSMLFNKLKLLAQL